MKRRSSSLVVVVALLVGCGGGGGGNDGDGAKSLLAAEGGGSVDGRTFTPTYGISFVRASGTVSVVVGTGKLDCEMAQGDQVPEDGTYVEIQVPGATLGVPERHFVDFIVVSGGQLDVNGSGEGTVEVLAASGASIKLRVDFDHVSSFNQLRYVLQGAFEVVRCP